VSSAAEKSASLPKNPLSHRRAFVASGVGGDKLMILLPLPLQLFSFAIFGPKIACQAPKQLNSLKQNKIEVAI
jgi:hypothetical protein